MIITRCESKTEQQRHQMRIEMKQDQLFGDHVKLFGQNIYFSGSINYDDWNNGYGTVYDQFVTIYEYRKNLLEFFRMSMTTCVMPIWHSPLGAKGEMNRYVLLISVFLVYS
jgi:hypothetical protein